MYKLFLVVISIILLSTTLCVSFFNPTMHKSIFIYDSQYKIVEEQQVKKDIKIQEKTNTKTPKQTVKTVTETKTATKKTNTKTSKETKSPTVKSTSKTVKKTESTPIKTKVKTVKEKQTPNVLPKQTTENTQVIQTPKTATVVETKNQIENPITEEEKIQQELIQWNIWRSNLQNQIMKDAKLPIIQQGTIFRFSFDVDKYGRISNVQTWSLTPTYTPYAIQYIAPVIRSYQGQSILTFPSGSNRFSTTVEGGWKISNKDKYSTPDDFSDTEKIIKD